MHLYPLLNSIFPTIQSCDEWQKEKQKPNINDLLRLHNPKKTSDNICQ